MKTIILALICSLSTILFANNAFAFKDGSCDGWCSIAACQMNADKTTYSCHTGGLMRNPGKVVKDKNGNVIKVIPEANKQGEVKK